MTTPSLFDEARLRQQSGDLIGAAALYREIAEGDPANLAALNGLGNALQLLNRLDDAIAAYRQAIAIQPHPLILNNLGNAYQAQGKLDNAVICYSHAIAGDPSRAEPFHNLATALKRQNRICDAERYYRQALTIAPDYPEALCGLGSALQLQGKLSEAIESYRQALRLSPRFDEAKNNLLFALNCLPGVSASGLLHETRMLTAPFRDDVRPGSPPPTVGGGKSPLRLGYVSGDFRAHPVGHFLTGVIEHHDTARVLVHCYSNNSSDDEVTERLRRAVPCWRNIRGMPDTAAAELIRSDGIDVLIDLSGHTADGRLGIFALRPAALQASWLGFFGTVSMPGIDAMIADETVVTAQEEPHYAEEVWRLPGCYLSFSPPVLRLEPAARPPFEQTGVFTFGCFNRRDKITEEVVRLWAQILRAVPNSRLIIKNHSLADGSVAAALREAFTQGGVDPPRLNLEGPSQRADYLEAYRRVDLALDPFPFAGGTTTAEALWMGVPVLSLRGDSWAGRISASLLRAVGLNAMIVENQEDYLHRAIALARVPGELAETRTDLRKLAYENICNHPRFAECFEGLIESRLRRSAIGM